MIGHAGTTRISLRTLDIRDFTMHPFNPPSNHPLTGQSDAIYRGDLLEAIKEKAKANSTIMNSVHYVFMRQTLLDRLTVERTTIENNLQKNN